jgi:DNA polymerase IV
VEANELKTILHVDMDAFYASVEQHDDPALRGRPVIVGGRSRRGVVLAASYEVRPLGVRSAMSMREALRRAPNAIVVPPRHRRYEEMAAAVFAIFRRYTPLVEPLSLDEAFLDVTASRTLFGDGETIARAIKSRIRDELGLTASAGVACVKFAAKIASDLGKPDGLVVVPSDDVAGFLAPLPVERMWGVGPKTAPRVRSLGFSTLGDLARANPELERAFGRWGRKMAALARGDDDREVDPRGIHRSIGAEQTYEQDLVGVEAIARTLLAHASHVARRLLDADVGARTVAVKIKYDDFAVRTRRITLPEPVQDTESIYRAARALLSRVPLQGRSVRLTGVSVAGLAPDPREPALFADASTERRRKLEIVAAQIDAKFGAMHALTRATLLEERQQRSSATITTSNEEEEPRRQRRAAWLVRRRAPRYAE